MQAVKTLLYTAKRGTGSDEHEEIRQMDIEAFHETIATTTDVNIITSQRLSLHKRCNHS